MDLHEDAHQDRQVVPVSVGTLAPDFTLPQTASIRIALHGLLGQPVVIVFYPMDWEPVSRDQLVLYQKFAHEIAQLGAHLLGISVDSAYCHAAFAREAQLRFPAAGGFPAARRRLRVAVRRVSGGPRRERPCTLTVLDRRHVIRLSKVYPDALNPGVDEVLTSLETLATTDAEDTEFTSG